MFRGFFDRALTCSCFFPEDKLELPVYVNKIDLVMKLSVKSARIYRHLSIGYGYYAKHHPELFLDYEGYDGIDHETAYYVYSLKIDLYLIERALMSQLGRRPHRLIDLSLSLQLDKGTSLEIRRQSANHNQVLLAYREFRIRLLLEVKHCIDQKQKIHYTRKSM